ncbi:hypothetical protein [Streptomyces sp. NPDC002537]
MAWSRIDDSLHSHPKIMLVGNAATGLFVRLISYAGQHLTDGFVPAHVARAYGTPRLLNALCDANLLTRVDPKSNQTSETHPHLQGPGFVIHDYLDYNPSREQVHAERAKNAARQEAFRRRKRGQESPPNDSSEPAGNEVSNGVTNAATNGAPARPGPTRPPEGVDVCAPHTSSRGRAEKAHTPIPTGFEPSAHSLAWAERDGHLQRLGGHEGLTAVTAAFVDWHTAKGTTAADPNALWRKWVREQRTTPAAIAPTDTTVVPFPGTPPLSKTGQQRAALAAAREQARREGKIS